MAKFHIRYDRVSYCRKTSYGEEQYKRMHPFDNPHCDIDEHYDSYEEAYRALQKQNGIEFSLDPKIVDSEIKKQYDEFWKGQFTYFGEEDEDPMENYDWAEVHMGHYESAMSYYFKFDGERVHFISENYDLDEVHIADWAYNDFLEISTQLEIDDKDAYLEELVKSLLLAYDCKFEYVEYII